MSLTSGKELTKTLLFVGAAVVVMGLAISTRPRIETGEQLDSDEVGLPLFPELTDTTSVTGLEVLSFNEELGSLKPFKIEQARAGEWIIPSRQGYPADAQDRVARAATMFVDLKVLRVEQDPDHEKLGVVEPKFGSTKMGDEGVGTLFKVLGGSNQKSNTALAELIIGKPVKDLPGQHYVRRPGKSRVYRVEIDPSQLSTDFVDWIDTRLLPFSPELIKRIGLRNYTTQVRETEQGNALDPSISYEATFEPKPGEWDMVKFREFRNGGLVDSQLGPGEVVQQKRLNELVAAIELVSIANVQRTPAALAEKLRAGNAELTSVESASSLAGRGFYPVKTDGEPGRILAAQGEFLADVVNGIQFRLLIGGLGQQAGEIEGGGSLYRFVMVWPQLNMEAFPEPELEPLPSADEEMSENDRKIAVERINKENERRKTARAEQLEVAEKQVQVLRDRYADWYYLVPESVIRRFRIPRSELVALSEQALREGSGIEAFRMLQSKGLRKVEE